MTRMPSVWVEGRCGSVTGGGGANWQMPEACHQTAREGGFFSSMVKVRKHHERQGWRIIDGEWWCPVCVKLLKQ